MTLREMLGAYIWMFAFTGKRRYRGELDMVRDGRYSKVVWRACAVQHVGGQEVTEKGVRLPDRGSVRQKSACMMLSSLS